MIRRNWRSASSMPAAVQRRHISPDCQRLTLRLERRTHQALSGLLAMAEALVLGPPETSNVGTDTPGGAMKVARHLAELTCSVLGCERVGIVAVEEETDEVRPVASAGLPPEQEHQWRQELEKTPCLSDWHGSEDGRGEWINSETQEREEGNAISR